MRFGSRYSIKSGNKSPLSDCLIKPQNQKGSEPLMSHALRVFLILVFVVGVLVRVFSPELHVTKVGDILIAVAILGRLLIYVRGLNPSSFRSISDPRSLLGLNPERRKSFTAYDETNRTPVERVILDK